MEKMVIRSQGRQAHENRPYKPTFIERENKEQGQRNFHSDDRS